MGKRNRGSGPVAVKRLAAGHTQATAAESLDITTSHLARIEGGFHDPSVSLVSGMADLYRVPIADMIRAVEGARRRRARIKTRLIGLTAADGPTN